MVSTGFSIKSTETGRTEMTRTRAICVNAGLPLRSALPGLDNRFHDRSQASVRSEEEGDVWVVGHRATRVFDPGSLAPMRTLATKTRHSCYSPFAVAEARLCVLRYHCCFGQPERSNANGYSS